MAGFIAAEVGLDHGVGPLPAVDVPGSSTYLPEEMRVWGLRL